MSALSASLETKLAIGRAWIIVLPDTLHKMIRLVDVSRGVSPIPTDKTGGATKILSIAQLTHSQTMPTIYAMDAAQFKRRGEIQLQSAA